MVNASRERDRTVRLNAKDQSPPLLGITPESNRAEALRVDCPPTMFRPQTRWIHWRVGNLLCHGDLPHYLEDMSKLLKSERHRHNNEMKVVAKIAPLPYETFCHLSQMKSHTRQENARAERHLCKQDNYNCTRAHNFKARTTNRVKGLTVTLARTLCGGPWSASGPPQ